MSQVALNVCVRPHLSFQLVELAKLLSFTGEQKQAIAYM